MHAGGLARRGGGGWPGDRRSALHRSSEREPFVSVPIASGIGEARNAIIASACFALVAVGAGHGTLSEIALGLKMERLVVTMPDANRVDGALECTDVDTAMEAIAERYFRVAP